jgi:hypothetical protein
VGKIPSPPFLPTAIVPQASAPVENHEGVC